jgi:CheY-like chemotaxis protein
MPGMNGIEFARIVRERSPQSALILMTGLVAADLFRSSRAHAFLQKPFSADALREVLGSTRQMPMKNGGLGISTQE